MFKSKEKRSADNINAGSMADIAFLLLIFFLVTTVISDDKGILVKLPIWQEDQEPVDVNTNNVLSIKINALNQVLLENKTMGLGQIKETVKLFIMNPDENPKWPDSPKKAIVSLQHDRGTGYGTYLDVYDALKGAYAELWEASALQLYGKGFDLLRADQQYNIRKEIPFVISEAEPTEFPESTASN